MDLKKVFGENTQPRLEFGQTLMKKWISEIDHPPCAVPTDAKQSQRGIIF
jgi:hypothetical protein